MGHLIHTNMKRFDSINMPEHKSARIWKIIVLDQHRWGLIEFQTSTEVVVGTSDLWRQYNMWVRAPKKGFIALENILTISTWLETFVRSALCAKIQKLSEIARGYANLSFQSYSEDLKFSGSTAIENAQTFFKGIQRSKRQYLQRVQSSSLTYQLHRARVLVKHSIVSICTYDSSLE